MPPLGFLSPVFRALPLAMAGLLLALRPAAGVEITPVPPQATRRVATVQVRVAPDHRDWTYVVGEPARFRVSVVADNEPIEGASITYTTGPEGRPAESRTALVPLDGLVIEGGTMPVPGFLRCTVETTIAGRKSRGVATVAFSPEKIAPTQTEPADFDAFWQTGKEALAKIPFEPRLTLLPEACTDKVNVYHVSFRNLGESWQGKARVYGILCEPKAPGQYPAVLRVPGAGVRPYTGDKDTAALGAITLQIGVHGIPVNLPAEVYEQLGAGALNRYQFFNLDDREAYYFRRVYLGCIRANDFLATRPMWDGTNLLVAGASQGGALSIATAALDPRVTAVAVTHPGYCDVTGDLHGRAGGWPRPFQKLLEPGEPGAQARIATTSYYDTVNFARRLKVPGYYTWGYNDDVCAPTSVYAAYNVITAPKELGLTLELAHSYTPEQWDAIQAWIVRTLGLK